VTRGPSVEKLLSLAASLRLLPQNSSGAGDVKTWGFSGLGTDVSVNRSDAGESCRRGNVDVRKLGNL